MNRSSFQIILKSITFYRKPVLYQILIIGLLSAVITGSLLTGRSVRSSLKKSASERLGNTGILISSGIRYFDTGLVKRLGDKSGISCTGLLEINGYSQSLQSQKGAFNTHIYAVDNTFFKFHGNDSVILKQGEVAINNRLADQLELKKGDELIIRYKGISDIPADAPFAPASVDGKSVVMKIGAIIGERLNGNFSLSISQITPMNIFISISDLEKNEGKSLKFNRLLIDKASKLTSVELTNILKGILVPADAGFNVRPIEKSGEAELISDRIFIDEVIIKEVKKLLPYSAPVITYLGNRLTSGKRSAPYSFVSALPSSLYPEIASGNGIIINKWLANDLDVNVEDSMKMYWYSPDSLNKLIERSSWFIVKKIVEMKGIWGDSLLMPDFPGISGSESCSDWDAGVPIKMNEIRTKDEDYWNKFKGTPKAFINYEKGREIWGNNFGPATSIRFPAGVTTAEVLEKLSGALPPDLTGFTVTDLYDDAIKAADKSVDFGTLFISLGFFLIVAAIVLLSFAVSYYFDSKRENVYTYFALGFKNGWIEKHLYLESLLIGTVGCFIGAFAGYLVNIIITGALNSVWSGAVQTNTLDAYFSIVPVITGFVISIIIMMVFMLIKTKKYLKRLTSKVKEVHIPASQNKNLFFLIISIVTTVSLFTFSKIFTNQEILFSFGAGMLLLITFILSWRQYYIGSGKNKSGNIKGRKGLSRLYYSFYPSNAVTPILFIAAGIFAVFITGVNRMNFDEKHLQRSAGTGGYLLWCESNIPVEEDLTTASGRNSLGFNEDSLSAMSFTTVKRSSGNDASCLNLNHITSPPLLGIDPADFISKGAFSFAKMLPDKEIKNPWQFLDISSEANTIYGIADQTVLDWGLMISVGDTLILRAENGQPVNIIIAAGLQSSVFQGYVIIGKNSFTKLYPSISGTSVLLVDGEAALTNLYKKSMEDRLANYGVNIEKTTDRLASFYEVSNTYLSVFGVFGALGMITGIAGLGFVLLRNYNHRKREFALMLAAGFSFTSIRRIILSEQVLILFAGVTSGILSAIVATLPSVKGSHDVPWLFLVAMVSVITATGLLAIVLSVRSISGVALISALKKE